MSTSQYYESEGGRTQKETELAQRVTHCLEGKNFVRLLPERDVTPEPSGNSATALSSGKYVTTMIQNIYNRAEYNRGLVTKTLLNAVNEVVMPDYEFVEIAPRQVEGSDAWEINLRERAGELVPLSASGSGLKTILCVVALLSLAPRLLAQDRSASIFAFEELEGHMHPALLRRLLSYVVKRIRKENSILFLTTHSNVVIDYFAADPEAQIVHVTKNDRGESVCSAVTRYLEHRDVLDALDCRASDLLQSNGIIWVEGPSDRTYVKRWIELHSNGELREGTHYQCAFYGGRLLSHLDAAQPSPEENDFLSILRVNRNAAVLIDSDRASPGSAINATKQRICDELESSRGYCWVTNGREIENYLPRSAIAIAADQQMSVDLQPFEDIGEFLERHGRDIGKRFERTKTAFAVRAAAATELKDISGVMDWSERMTELCLRVREWNRLPATE
jgi:Predicted ATPases